MLPFFKRMESYEGGGDDAFRGREGPLRVTNPEPRDPLYKALIKAAGEVGIRHNPDYNGARQDGIAMSQATIAGGRRMSTAHCYLTTRPQATQPAHRDGRTDRGARARGQALHRRALFRRRQPARGARRARGGGERRHHQLSAAAGAVGHRPARAAARPRHRGAPRAARRRREPARPLRAAHALGRSAPRASPSTTAAAGSASCTRRCATRSPARACSAWWRRRCAPSSAPATAWRRPTCCSGWVPMLTEPGPKGPKISRQSGMTCYAHPMRPESKGHVHITSADPRTAACDQLQLPVGADRRRADRARHPHCPRHHDGAGDGAPCR